MYRWVFFTLLAGAFLLPDLPTAHATTLKIATLAPDGTTWMQELRRGGEEIAKRTDGRVKLKFYPGGVMGNDKTVLRKIRAGQLHGGAFASGSLTGVYRDSVIYGLPFLFRSYDEAAYVRSRMDEMIREGLERGGMVALAISEGGFAYILSDEPLRTVDDLKGKKVWMPEGDLISEIVLEIAGVAPVPLPIADVYTGLQTGLVDTVASSPTAVIALQWHTKVKYLTDVPLFYLIGMLAVDKKAFNKIGSEDQAVMREVTAEIFEKLDRRNREDNEKAGEALKEQGIVFITPSAEQLQRWRVIARESQARSEEAGACSTEGLEVLRRHLEDYRSKSREADGG